jgi:disulfide bond formation protein DsbB
MISPKLLLIAIALTCVGLEAGAVYFQYTAYMLPCPWCLIQRDLYTAIALTCAITAFRPAALRRGAALGAFFGLAGIGAATWLVWVQAHPSVSCGIDPVETSLNKIPTAKLLPFLFKANGLCTTEYDPILGLSMPVWSLLAFIGMTLVLVFVATRRRRA